MMRYNLPLPEQKKIKIEAQKKTPVYGMYKPEIKQEVSRLDLSLKRMKN